MSAHKKDKNVHKIVKKDEDTWIVKANSKLDEKDLIATSVERMRKLYSEAIFLYESASTTMEKTQVLKLIKEVLKDERSFFMEAGFIKRAYKGEERGKVQINGVPLEEATEENIEDAMGKVMLEMLSDKANKDELLEMFKKIGVNVNNIHNVECKVIEE